jgi:hypothetical protein
MCSRESKLSFINWRSTNSNTFPNVAVLSGDVLLFCTVHSEVGAVAACLLAGIVGLIPADSMNAFSASDRSLVQRSPTYCGVSVIVNPQ